MKLIIAGSRKFNDYPLLKRKLDYLLKNVKEEIEIVSGKCYGADELGERYAREKGYKIHPFPAEWEKYQKKAGYIRNKQMAEYATHCIVFWDGSSPGSKHMIELSKEYGLILRVIMV